MSPANQPDTDELLTSYSNGDAAAESLLLTRFRPRLKRLVEVRLDRRLVSRVDASDVVQETLIQASLRLPEYASQRPMAFYPWIRQLAIEQIAYQHRRHIQAMGRSVTREAINEHFLPEQSGFELAMRLAAEGTSPSEDAANREMHQVVRQVLEELTERDRELLVLRFLEQLTAGEAAEVLGETLDAIKSRQRRALERFSQLFAKYTAK